MIKNLLRTFLLLTGTTVAFFSCVNLDTEEQVVADAYICSRIIGSDTMYVFGGYVNASTTMKSITLTNPDASRSIDLKILDYYGYYFERPIGDADYNSSKPQNGNYQFSIVYGDGTTSNVTNIVSSDILSPINLTEVKTDTINQSITVKWEKNSSADCYVARFYKNDTVIYISNEIDPGYSSMIVYTYSSGWNSNITLHSGDSLKVEISGILYESDYSSLVQSVSFSKKIGFAWPE
ncbi:MAG TPA: hypothetical protein PLB87_04730 [Prolixibacteraceae bacterium]|nr:hypothetical protein [Prolixibacteraceae bacterium]